MLRKRDSVKLSDSERMTFEEMVHAHSISAHKDLTMNNIRCFVEQLLLEAYNMGEIMSMNRVRRKLCHKQKGL